MIKDNQSQQIKNQTGMSTISGILIAALVALIIGGGIWYYFQYYVIPELDNTASETEITIPEKQTKTDDNKQKQEVVADISIETDGTTTGQYIVGTKFTIKNNNQKVGEISVNDSYQIEIFKQTSNNVYFSLTPDGRGGYILYSGPNILYKLNLQNNKLSKVFGSEDSNQGFVCDISPDENWIVFMQDDYSVGTKVRGIKIININNNKTKTFNIDSKYEQAGDALFSFNGKKIVYAAAVGNPDNENGGVYIIEISSSSQTTVKENPGAPNILKWIDNNIVDYSF